jgi:hypothetical protein
MQHWKLSLKDRMKQQLAEELDAAVDARVDKVVAFGSTLRARGEEVRITLWKKIKAQQKHYAFRFDCVTVLFCCFSFKQLPVTQLQTLLLLLCVWEWRKVAVSLSMRRLKSRVDEINGERRRLEKVVTIMRKVQKTNQLKVLLVACLTLCRACDWKAMRMLQRSPRHAKVATWTTVAG